MEDFMKVKVIMMASAMALLLVACSNDSETAAPSAMADMRMRLASLEDVINDERRADNRGRDKWRHTRYAVLLRN